MPYFTLHRNYVLRTTKGATIEFKKGEPAWVPPACVPDAVGIGAVSSDDVDVLGEDAVPVVTISPEERQIKLTEAFNILVNRNERGDFTASGLPHVKKLGELLGFEVSNRERDAAWQAYQGSLADE